MNDRPTVEEFQIGEKSQVGMQPADGSKRNPRMQQPSNSSNSSFSSLNPPIHNNNDNDNSSSYSRIPDTATAKDSSTHGKDSERDGTSRLIEEASAAVVQAAVAMKRSDSILTVSDDGSNPFLEDSLLPPRNYHGRTVSDFYMEEASMEASLIKGNQYHVAPCGRMGRQHTDTSTNIIDLNGQEEGSRKSTPTQDDSDNDFQLSHRGAFVGISAHEKDDNVILKPIAATAKPKTMDAINANESSTNTLEEAKQFPPIPTTTTTTSTTKKLPQLLESCGPILTQPSRNYSENVVLLHALFKDFCIPTISMQNVQRILLKEQQQHLGPIDLPTDVVIEKPSVALINLFGPSLLQVPLEFALGLFRILLRLLTNDSDDDYDRETLLTCAWYNEEDPSNPMAMNALLTRQRTYSTSSLKRQASFSEKSFNRGTAARKMDLMYNVVRLQRNWGNAVQQIYSLLETLLKEQPRGRLLAPVIRLLGLLCTGGVSVQILRRMISLASNPNTEPKAQLLLIRALSQAAEGSSRSSILLGKASPRHFFSFGYGPGISRTVVLQKSPWPFRNDFGVALWFRAERFCGSSVLFRAANESGNGIEISLVPPEKSQGAEAATVLAVSMTEDGNIVQCIKVNSCVLLPRVWYHVAVRHTRSRLKGVFSLSSREQVSIMLDGKLMVTEPLKFPVIRESANLTMSLTFCANFDGQSGALYVFDDNVSDTTFRALYEVTAQTSGVIQRRASAHDWWDSRRGDIVKRSKILDVNLRRDDAEEIVLSQRFDNKVIVTPSSAVVDLQDDEDAYENNPLSKAAFISRLYLVWDPRRIEGAVALELHSGAHVRMDVNNVKPWCVEGAQDVISSIGGVQTLLPIFRSVLGGRIEKLMGDSSEQGDGSKDISMMEKVLLCSLIPDMFSLITAFVRDHNENARELLRCGGVDMVEQLLHANKKLGTRKTASSIATLMESVSTFPGLSSILVDSLLNLRSACSHYVGLETKVFSRLLFNLPLWFGGIGKGVSLYVALLPVLSSVSRKNPEKVRDCIDARDLVHMLKEIVEIEDNEKPPKNYPIFDRQSTSIAELHSPLTTAERRHVVDVLLGIMFQVLASGTTLYGLSNFLHVISHFMESEWELASKDIGHGILTIVRQGTREERYSFTVKGCAVIMSLLSIRPPVPNLYESFAQCCGSVQGGAGWILSSMVNCHCDKIRAIGVRCIVSYVERTARSDDVPLSLERPLALDLESTKVGDARSIPSNTLSLISNVGQGFLNSNVGSRLAGIGPKASSYSPSKLTARVVYKLLWHLLKCHRYRLGIFTQSSLISMAVNDSKSSPFCTMGVLSSRFLASDDILADGVKIDMEWVETILSDTTIGEGQSLNNPLGISTVMRILRYIPLQFTDHWLSTLVDVAMKNGQAVSYLSRCPDWQPCIFQLISEVLEQISSTISSRKATNDKAKNEACDAGDGMASLRVRFDLSLELYAILLGHAVREGGDKALRAVEDAASLQRVCLNGPEVLSLILSRLISNLSTFGVLPLEAKINLSKSDENEPNALLKRSARLVTSAILSNGTAGLDMPAAVGCWRSLRHLTAVVVAIITKFGCGVAELFDYRSQNASAIDKLSGGLHGIRLPEGDIKGILAVDFVALLHDLMSGSSPPSDKRSVDDAGRNRKAFCRVCVILAAQILFLLDVFIFPDSLDASLPASQLHGLALVRSTETRLGNAQGPLLASAIRLSLQLLCQLEPCSVKLLQCCSRLRCFLHWTLELIRESEALDGYSAAFNDLSAPLDRLILAIVLQCHRALGRCGSLLSEIESAPFSTYFESKESQKKYYRRLLRVALELRDIVLTTYQGRHEVLRTALSTRAIEALQLSLEVQPVPPDDSASSAPGKGSHQKEAVIRNLLGSDWVSNFRDVEIRGRMTFPEQVELGENSVSKNIDSSGAVAVEDLFRESNAIVECFEKSLNSCFEKYLEAQRIWAETGAVRDLEFEGDTNLKRLSGRHKNDLNEVMKLLALRSGAAVSRWQGIDRKIIELWQNGSRWKLPRCTDQLGRRILLVRNRHFDDHHQASYDLLMGLEREKEERAREERMRKKKELEELMKRNTDAIVPYSGNEHLDVEDEENDSDDVDSESDREVSQTIQGDDSIASGMDGNENGKSRTDGLDEKKAEDSGSDVILDTDADAWAKVFIWSDSESVVARFSNVMVVTLQCLSEGNLLLTTHGLYFHHIGDDINVMTKEPAAKSDERNDRRWRLSRLTEVLGRRYMLRPQAIELFFSDSNELFLNFLGGNKERDRFYAKLRNSCKVPMLFSPKSLNPRTVFKKSKLTDLWRKRKISNFQYLMEINKMAGRTFNDIAQYPVFPWILADYKSETIDLNDSRVYRDLSKPVGALNPNRLAQLLERYNELEQFGFSESEKFLYGSHYSSPGIVLHYLLRQEPFTTLAIELQSGRFDCPDRLFLDMGESWQSCNTSSSDVKELIPEFFTLPEMLLNTNDFPLGHMQTGRLVDDVGLPPWAKGSAHEFIRIHRLALESEYVSSNLNRWIDLIFGHQQRGPEAEAAHNVFHHLSYEGSVDLDKITDEVDRRAAESQIQNFGQTPSQLLVKEAHPRRYTAEECWRPLLNEASAAKLLRCYTPSKQFGGQKGFNAAVAKIHVQGDNILVVYSDFSVGSYKWSPRNNGNRLKPDKLRVLPNRALSNSRAAIKRGSAAPQTMNDSGSSLAVGNWSFAVTQGGYEKEQLRRKALMPSRLASAKDALYTETSPLVVSCGYWDSTVKIHSVDAWRLECSETGGHRGAIRCLAVGQDGGLLVTGGEDATCRVWVVDHPDMAIALSDGYVQTALGQSNDGEQVLSCCHVLWGHETSITCLDLSSDLDVVASGSADGVVCIHTIRRGDFIRSIRPQSKHHDSVSRLAVDCHGRLVIHMGDGSLQTYTINGVCLACIDAGERLHDMKISREVLVTGGDRCHVYIRNIFDLQLLSMLDLSRHGPIRCISFTPEDLNQIPQQLFIGSDDGKVTIVDKEDVKT